MSTVTLSNTWSYDRMTRLFGGLWFMLLALCVAIIVGASPSDPWPSRLSSFCLASFYMLVALLIMTRPPAKAEAEGLLPGIAAFVGTYLPWTITFFGATDRALPNLASTACVLIGIIMMLVTIRHLGRSFSLVPQARAVVQTGPYRWIKHPLYFSEEIAIAGVAAAMPDTGNGNRTDPASRSPGMPNSLRRRPASAHLSRVFQLRSISLEIDPLCLVSGHGPHVVNCQLA